MTSGLFTAERLSIARGNLAKPAQPFALFLLSMFAWLWLGPAIMKLLGVVVTGVVSSAIFLTMVAGFSVYLSLHGHVLLGSDGVYIARRNDQKFVAFDNISHIGHYRASFMGKEFIGVRLTLHDGQDLKLPIGHGMSAHDRRTELTKRLETALSAYRKHHHPEGTESLTSNAHASQTWLEQLQRIGAGANAD